MPSKAKLTRRDSIRVAQRASDRLDLNTLTSQIANEVVESHFALGFDVGRVHVGVEEDHGEGQDENGVRVVELLHHVWITHAVSLAARERKQQQQHERCLKKKKCCGGDIKKTACRAKANLLG